MSSYAWEKFHLAAEILRQEGDKKNLLAEAFAQEICHIKEEDIPPKYRKEIDFVFERLSLPNNVETLSRMAHPHHAVQSLTDNEVIAVVQTIFELEAAMNEHVSQGAK